MKLCIDCNVELVGRGYSARRCHNCKRTRDNARSRQWRTTNREKFLTSQKQQYTKNREKRRGESTRYHRQRAYGLSPEMWEEMLNKQEGKCVICKKFPPKWHVDHDHKTGKVRALLCNKCNVVLGMADDKIEVLQGAIHYLEKYNEPSNHQLREVSDQDSRLCVAYPYLASSCHCPNCIRSDRHL